MPDNEQNSAVVDGFDLTTSDGLAGYMNQTQFNDADDWNRRCDKVKSANSGGYPNFWFATVIAGGIMADRLPR